MKLERLAREALSDPYGRIGDDPRKTPPLNFQASTGLIIAIGKLRLLVSD